MKAKEILPNKYKRGFNMREEFIKEYPSQRILGIIRHNGDGTQSAHDFPSGRYLGIYDERTDETLDFPSSRVIAKGNILASLIYNQHK